jgi:hypothetical protein
VFYIQSSVTQRTDKGFERETHIHTDTYLPYRQHENKYKFLVLLEKVLTVGRPRAVGIPTTLRAGQFGVQIPVDSKFCTFPVWPWGPYSLLYNVYRVLWSGYSARCPVLTTHHNLNPRLKKSIAITLLPLLYLCDMIPAELVKT